MLAWIMSFLLAAQDPNAQDLQEQLDDLQRQVNELKSKQAETLSANPATVLNPTITVFGNFLWRLDNDEVLDEAGDEIDDTARMREVELDLRAAIDPYVDGVFVLAAEAEVPGEYEVGVEEFLVNIKSLPLAFWEEPPLGAKIKLGRMRTDFGRSNRLHLHDLPQPNRPAVVEEFLGEEGHIADGASVQVFLPSPGDTALELTVQALQGGDIGVGQDAQHPFYLAHLRWFVPLADEHSFDVGAIGAYGTTDRDGDWQSRTLSLDFLYRWKPLRQGEYRSLIVGGQVFKSVGHEFGVDLDLDGIPDMSEETKPLGYYVWAQYQLSKGLYAGLRYDRTEFLEDDASDRRKIQPYLSCYVSEFFRVRAAYERTDSDDPEEDELQTFLLEVNVVFGAHPPHPFWVNR